MLGLCKNNIVQQSRDHKEMAAANSTLVLCPRYVVRGRGRFDGNYFEDCLVFLMKVTTHCESPAPGINILRKFEWVITGSETICRRRKIDPCA